MKYILTITRVIVGNLFIFSGVVKANDPLGFSYKLEEYFVEFGMDWAWLHEILVPMAAAICVAEIILGFAVLVGYKMKQVSWSLMLMIVFFTILTGASAIFEIVRSCGCFGDAIPLTPWESFYKDLILLALIIILFIKRKSIQPDEGVKPFMIVYISSWVIMFILSNMLDWMMPLYLVGGILTIRLLVEFFMESSKKVAAVTVIWSLVMSILLTVFSVIRLPSGDFRPYAIGKNLPEQMKLPPNAQASVYENILVYKNKKTGELKEMNDVEYTASKLWEDDNWEWQSTDSKLIKQGDEAKITDLSILTHNSEDVTDEVLSKDRILWIVSYDMSLMGTDQIEEINQIAASAQNDGIQVIGLSSAGLEEKDKMIQEHKLNFDFLVTDGIVLKTMIRSNPGLMYLEKGTVKGKWHENKLPENVAELKASH